MGERMIRATRSEIIDHLVTVRDLHAKARDIRAFSWSPLVSAIIVVLNSLMFGCWQIGVWIIAILLLAYSYMRYSARRIEKYADEVSALFEKEHTVEL